MRRARAAPAVGDSWRERFDSLVLFTPRALSALPGLPHDGDPQGFPGKDEMGDYLERYADIFELPVHTNRGVARLSRCPQGFLATTARGQATMARAVVIATGGFQHPRRPSFADALSRHVQQLDPLTYRSPDALDKGDVVVLGDGATGRQIALENAPTRPVTLATGRRRLFGPQGVFGRDTTGLALQAELLIGDAQRSGDATTPAAEPAQRWAAPPATVASPIQVSCT